MGVLHRFRLIVGVPADWLEDASGRTLLAQAMENAERKHASGRERDVVGHLDELLPAPLRAFEGGAWSYGGERLFVVGKEVLDLKSVKGLHGWDAAGPLSEDALEAARREVTDALAGMGGLVPRLILLGHMT